MCSKSSQEFGLVFQGHSPERFLVDVPRLLGVAQEDQPGESDEQRKKQECHPRLAAATSNIWYVRPRQQIDAMIEQGGLTDTI